jgi:golgi SNAP receptor complex member 1
MAISQAFEAKNTLNNQRNLMNSSNSGVSSINSSIPGIGRLIDAIQKKRSRETIVIAVVIGLLLSFTLW